MVHYWPKKVIIKRMFVNNTNINCKAWLTKYHFYQKYVKCNKFVNTLSRSWKYYQINRQKIWIMFRLMIIFWERIQAHEFWTVRNSRNLVMVWIYVSFYSLKYTLMQIIHFFILCIHIIMMDGNTFASIILLNVREHCKIWLLHVLRQ